MGPLLPDDGSRGARLQRRVRGIAIETLALVLVTLLFPVLLLAAVAVDLVLWVVRRKPWMAVRLLALAWWFLAGELRGVTLLFAIGARSLFRDTPRRRRGVYRLRQSWCAGHLAGVMRLFGMTLEIEGLELAGPGPELGLIRHPRSIANA